MIDAERVYVSHDATADYPHSAPFDPSELYPELAQLGPIRVSDSKNDVYAAIRRLLAASGFDAEHLGGPEWNPLGELVRPGGTVVLKPNMVRHYNPAPGESVESVVTHWSLVRAIGDYALIAVGPAGRVVVVEAPQHDCELGVLRPMIGADRVLSHWASLPRTVDFVDARNERVVVREGVLMKTVKLPGDPQGAVLVDLDGSSEFSDPSIDTTSLRGSDYDDRETQAHHTGGKNEYLLSGTVMGANLLISLPKLKAHSKIGMTCALKNLVGVNADKNYLPHWRVGFSGSGGDQFARPSFLNRVRSSVFKAVRPLLRIGPPFTWLAVVAAWVLHAVGLHDNLGAGTWHGNDTIWRTTLDLNKALLYADESGHVGAEPFRSRSQLCLTDAIVAGEGEGPLAPNCRQMGVIALGSSALACDFVLARLAGLDWRRLKFLERALRASNLPLAGQGEPESIAAYFVGSESGDAEAVAFERIEPICRLRPPRGWLGHVEMQPREHGGAAAKR